MNDETKAALESLRREMADGDPDWWKRERLIFNHIDGEPARLAAAREEWERTAVTMDDALTASLTVTEERLEKATAERDALRMWVSTVAEALGAIEPVSDCRVELGADAAASVAASLRARVSELEADRERLEAAEESALKQVAAEHHGRITAEAQVAEAHERLDEFGMRRDGERATLVEGIDAMRERIDEYRAEWYTAEAQVAAARAECARLVDRPWSRWAGDAGRDVLRAMDEAAKK